MTIMDQLRADYLAARKARDILKVNLLSTLTGEATAIGKDHGDRPTTDAEALSLIGKYVKRAEDTLVILATQGTPKAAEAAITITEEVRILKSYLPSLMTGEALAEAIKAIISETPGANMGTIMAALKSKHSGAYDGKAASALVKEALAK